MNNATYRQNACDTRAQPEHVAAHPLAAGAVDEPLAWRLWLAQHLNVLAYRFAPAAAIQPADASRLIVALAIDSMLFGVLPSAMVVGGAILILVAAMYGRIAWSRRRTETA